MNTTFKVKAVSALAVLVALVGCASGAAQRSAGETVDDGVVLAKVKTALVENDLTKARQIDVEVFRGDVQLNGFVDSQAAKAAATTTAKNVAGVRMVNNNLQIRAMDRSAGEVIDDTKIAAQVKTALIGDSRTKAHQIEVQTNAGIVQLGGFVDNAASKAAAAEVAGAVNGVRNVVNGIQVRTKP